MILFELGRVKRHSYPLPRLMIVCNRNMAFHKSIQWCFAYKMFKVSFIEVYYFSPNQK